MRAENMTSHGTPVFLHVYDLYNQNVNKAQYMATGAACFHAGVEVYGNEFCYGYNDTGETGLCKMWPGEAEVCYAAHREPIAQGYTYLSETEVFHLFSEMADEWLGKDYNLLSKNCCTFARVFLERLGAEPMPGWVDRAARRGFESAASRATQAVGVRALASRVAVGLAVDSYAGPASWAAFGGELVGGHVGSLVGENVGGDKGKRVGENVGGVGGAVGAGATVGACFGGPWGAGIGAGLGCATFAIGKGLKYVFNKADVNRCVTNVSVSALQSAQNCSTSFLSKPLKDH